ncbi:hypothetical protein M8C21_025904, partial [Ambrosia artemisiifolia]
MEISTLSNRGLLRDTVKCVNILAWVSIVIYHLNAIGAEDEIFEPSAALKQELQDRRDVRL